MGQLIFEFFLLFTGVPYNFWPWIFLVVIPLLIFSAKPHDSERRRLGRILAAILIGYALINITLQTDRALDRKAYEQCERQSKHPIDSTETFEECGHLVNIADGASNVFYMALGWIPAAAYAGLFEFWWRRKYREAIRSMGEAYEGRWFSTALIVCSVPVLCVMGIILILYIYTRIDCPPAIVANGTCWIRH